MACLEMDKGQYHSIKSTSFQTNKYIYNIHSYISQIQELSGKYRAMMYENFPDFFRKTLVYSNMCVYIPTYSIVYFN